GEDKPDCGDEVNQRAEYGFERVHLVNVAQPDEPEGGQHQDADAGPEVAAVDGDGELEEDRSPQDAPLTRSPAPGLKGGQAPNQSLRQEENRGEQDEERDQFREGLVAGESEEHAADQAAQNADGHKAPQPRPH